CSCHRGDNSQRVQRLVGGAFDKAANSDDLLEIVDYRFVVDLTRRDGGNSRRVGQDQLDEERECVKFPTRSMIAANAKLPSTKRRRYPPSARRVEKTATIAVP